VVVLAPIVALLPASTFDRGPSGEIRPTAFPIALAALDPYVWECAGNSLAMACAVTLVSGLVGVWLARRVVRTEFWGRTPLIALGCASIAVLPAFAALGLSALGLAGSRVSSWSDWGIWFWAESIQGVALVAMAACSAFAKVEPSWEDAARLAGASRGRAWRGLIWPTVRPDVARMMGLVFTLVLVEPGAPIVIGLRQTLAFQIVQAALDPDQIGRACVLALSASILAALGRMILRRRGGRHTVRWGSSLVPEIRMETPSLGRRMALTVSLGAAVAAAWLPVAGLLKSALQTGTGSFRLTAGAFDSLWTDTLLLRTLTHSAVAGGLVLAIVLVLSRVMASLATSRLAGIVRIASWPRAVPPLALGVGALAMPKVLAMIADGLAGILGQGSPIVVSTHALVEALDPDRTPWVLFLIAVPAVCCSVPARSAVEQVQGLRPVLVDAAVCLGTTPRRARRAFMGRWLGVSTGSAFLIFVLAATNLTPALVLCPTADVRTLGPTVLVLAGASDRSIAQASALALVAIGASLVALSLKRGSRGSWYVL
jgi:iron(III) transport system permease protein